MNKRLAIRVFKFNSDAGMPSALLVEFLVPDTVDLVDRSPEDITVEVGSIELVHEDEAVDELDGGDVAGAHLGADGIERALDFLAAMRGGGFGLLDCDFGDGGQIPHLGWIFAL